MADLVGILEALERRDVDFVALGNLAAGMQNVRVYTEDADVAVERGAVNRERLMLALADLEARYRMFDGAAGKLVDTSRPDMFLGSDIWGFITKHGPLDVLLVSPDGDSRHLSYEYLRQDAVVVHTGGGYLVMVASLPDIVYSKELANRPKDHLTLPILKAALEEQRGSVGGPD